MHDATYLPPAPLLRGAAYTQSLVLQPHLEELHHLEAAHRRTCYQGKEAGSALRAGFSLAHEWTGGGGALVNRAARAGPEPAARHVIKQYMKYSACHRLFCAWACLASPAICAYRSS
jgi:hypothetical protein